MKPQVMVLGSFRRTAGDDRIGGLSFACQSLVDSELKDSFRFLCVDSTITSIRSRSTLARLPGAARRLISTFWFLMFGRLRAVMCFSSHGTSFIEKGVLITIGSVLGRKMILLPRSGHLVSQVQRSQAFKRFVQLVLWRATFVVCQSESWRSYFRSLVQPSQHAKFIVIENWLSPSAFVEPEASNAGSGLTGGFVVGYMNRIEPEKGVFEFIQAVLLAHAANPAIRGVIHGDGGALEDVQARLREPEVAGIIGYGGWLDGSAKRSALRKLDAYLFASHAEGFPNSLLEVLALKVPVVSVRVGAVADVLEHGQSALLAEIGDAATMAAHLLALAENPDLRQRLAEQAYCRVSASNALPSAVKRFGEILQ